MAWGELLNSNSIKCLKCFEQDVPVRGDICEACATTAICGFGGHLLGDRGVLYKGPPFSTVTVICEKCNELLLSSGKRAEEGSYDTSSIGTSFKDYCRKCGNYTYLDDEGICNKDECEGANFCVHCGQGFMDFSFTNLYCPKHQDLVDKGLCIKCESPLGDTYSHLDECEICLYNDSFNL